MRDLPLRFFDALRGSKISLFRCICKLVRSPVRLNAAVARSGRVCSDTATKIQSRTGLLDTIYLLRETAFEL